MGQVVITLDHFPDIAQATRHHVIHAAGGVLRNFLCELRDAQALNAHHLAIVRRHVAHDHAQQGRLAGAVATDQTQTFAPLDGKIYAVEQRRLPEGEDDIAEGEDGHDALAAKNSGARILPVCRRLKPEFTDQNVQLRRHAGDIAAGGSGLLRSID